MTNKTETVEVTGDGDTYTLVTTNDGETVTFDGLPRPVLRAIKHWLNKGISPLDLQEEARRLTLEHNIRATRPKLEAAIRVEKKPRRRSAKPMKTTPHFVVVLGGLLLPRKNREAILGDLEEACRRGDYVKYRWWARVVILKDVVESAIKMRIGDWIRRFLSSAG